MNRQRRDPGALSGVLTGVSFLGGLAKALIASDEPYPRPGSDAATIRRYFHQPARPTRFSVPGQLLSAAALVGFTASVVTLAGRSGRDARGLQGAAGAGGAIAAGALAASALHAAALARDDGSDPERAIRLHRRAFLAGGPLHGAGFGVLLGVLGLAGRRTGDLPAPLTTAALAAAVPNVLAPLYFIAEPAGWLIPIGRFPGLVLIGAAGVQLTRGPG